MFKGLLPAIAKNEKELAVLEIVKSAERKSKRMDMAIHGKLAEWVHEWIIKRGHKKGGKGKDLALFIDCEIDSLGLQQATRTHRMVAAVFPSRTAASLPAGLSSNINARAVADEVALARGGWQVKSILCGLWWVASFGFDEVKSFTPKLSAAVIFFAFVMLLTTSAYPMDDLLRHVKAYQYDYDYGKLYAYSAGFSFNPYLLFDHFAGFLYASFGDQSLKIIQMLCLACLSAGFFLHTRSWDDRMRALVFVILLIILGYRITFARPAVFQAFFFITALLLSGLPAVIFGVFMGVQYYLFPIFLVPLVFIKREYAISVILSFLFWVAYAGTDYFTDIASFISHILSNRLISIAENASILLLLGDPLFLVLLYLFIKSKNYTYAIPLLLFTLINQIRFVDVVAPLLAISIVPEKIGWGKLRFGFAESVLFLAVLLALLGTVFQPYSLADLHVRNATVLCDTMQCMFNTVYTGSNISISPSMEVGFTEKEVQAQMVSMRQNGTIDCGLFKKYRYDILIEDSLKVIPPCLNLAGVERGYRIWNITR